MSRKSVIKKKRRGPAPTGKGTLIGVRIQPDQLKTLDNWIAKQREHRSRPEAIREILERALKLDQPWQVGPHKGASKARELARTELDRLGDASVTEEERHSRKRRILKGPEEFREMREDLPREPRPARAKAQGSNELRQKRAGVIKSAGEEIKRRRLGIHRKKSG
jgi:hypothetical protein